ncbi:MAG: M91 family zinc metallopeptidase [Sedimentisphaerales bacterium]
MTYSAYVTDDEKKPRDWTGFKGIAVTVDPAQPFFPTIVKEALTHLKALPTGSLLLSAIAQVSPADDRGFKVLIDRVQISYDIAMQGNLPTIKPRGGRSFASAAQQRLGVASDAAALQGEGVSVIIGWCQNQVTYTPKVGPNKGKMHFVPPQVTLGHELIHALHALKGKSMSGLSIMVGDEKMSKEEAYTVGLGPYEDKKYTENNLRHEVGLPKRLSYP